MKSEITEDREEQKYPYLGRFESGDIILFTGPGTGMCVCSGVNKIGEYSDNWLEHDSVTFYGTVTLSN